MTQKKFAEHMGAVQCQVSLWECGKSVPVKCMVEALGQEYNRTRKRTINKASF